MEKELIRTIECSCGMWEEMPADEQRHHSQTFTYMQTVDDTISEIHEAIYKCPDCKRLVISNTVEKED